MKDSQQFLAENNGGSLVGTAASLLALSWVTVGLRIYTRAVLMKSFMADDWLMLVAQVFIDASKNIRQKLLTKALDYFHCVLRYDS